MYLKLDFSIFSGDSPVHSTTITIPLHTRPMHLLSLPLHFGLNTIHPGDWVTLMVAYLPLEI